MSFNYPKPVKPPIVLAMDAAKKSFNKGMRMTNRRETLVEGLLLATRALLSEMSLGRPLTDKECADIVEYNKQVDEYNKHVDRYNAQQKRLREEAEARRAAQEIKQKRCNKCFMLHGPGQTECW